MRRDTILHVAARSGEEYLPTLAKVLSDDRVNLDARNEHNQTALHVAAACGNAQACELLIRSGAHIYAACDEGLTALHLATRNDRIACVSVLLKFGSNPYVNDAQGRSAVSYIATAAMSECYLSFFSSVRRNPTMLARLEKDLLWKDISDLLCTSSSYESFKYPETVPDSPKCGVPEISLLTFPGAYTQLHQVRS